jgi:hypothetical protein
MEYITVTTTRRWFCFRWTKRVLVPVPAPAVMGERERRYHQSNALGR